MDKGLKISRTSLLFSIVVFAVLMAVLMSMRLIGQHPGYEFLKLGGTQFLLLSALVSVLSLAVLFYSNTKTTFRNIFLAEAHPINLAIFRIVVCSQLTLFDLETSKDTILFFSSFPKELMLPPIGMKYLLTVIPVNPELALVTFWIFKISCFMALFGLFTRTALTIAVLSGLYAYGIPQFFGKVNHYHFIIWFLGILATSRCADVLSLDALRASWRRADKGELRLPSASIAYALPLRFAWVLLGIIYFFPGFWKIWISGVQWILNDTMRNYIYYQWMGYDNWVSPIRVDHNRLLCKMMAFSGVTFELSFLFLILSSRLRWIPITMGLVFHSLTYFIMRISFLGLQLCYVVFFDWDRIFRWIGQKVFRNDLFVVFDGNCKVCRRTIASLKTMDIFSRITYVNMFDVQAMKHAALAGLDQDAIVKDMHIVVNSKIFKGADAYRVLAFRIPFLWPVIPLLSIWPFKVFAAKIYRQVADSRTCSIRDHVILPHSTPAPKYGASRWTILVGIVLVVGNVLFGGYKIGGGWPFACFPTFEQMPGESYYSMEVVVENAEGKILKLDQLAMSKNFPPERFAALMHIILSIKDPARKAVMFKALWQVVTTDNPALLAIKKIQFYRLDLSVIPEKKYLNPLSRVLIHEIEVN